MDSAISGRNYPDGAVPLRFRVHFTDGSGRDFYRSVKAGLNHTAVAEAFEDDRAAGGGPIKFVRVEIVRGE